MELLKNSVTPNVKLFLLYISEFPDTSIRIFNTLQLKIEEFFLKAMDQPDHVTKFL